MEDRALLSVAAPTTTTPTTDVSTAIPISSVPTTAPLTAQNVATAFPVASAGTSSHPALAARRNVLAARAAARLAATDGSLSQNTSSPGAAVGATSALAAKTLWNGYWLTHSKDVATAGVQYTKTTFSHDARKVAGQYISAAFRGDGKEIAALGKSPLVKKVGGDFSQVASSPNVKTVGSKFTQFGRSVADRFHQIFG